MQSENEYIGDDKFKKFLSHYACPTKIEVVKMKFAGAVCSPNLDLRPTDVISSLWPQNASPRLETKTEAELFFKFFMGLWDDIYQKVYRNKFRLLPKETDNLEQYAHERAQELEEGYLEGFWGGQEDLKIPSYVAQILDSLSELTDVYESLAQKAHAQPKTKELKEALLHTDKMVEKSLSFIIENFVARRIEKFQQTVQ